MRPVNGQKAEQGKCAFSRKNAKKPLYNASILAPLYQLPWDRAQISSKLEHPYQDSSKEKPPQQRKMQKLTSQVKGQNKPPKTGQEGSAFVNLKRPQAWVGKKAQLILSSSDIALALRRDGPRRESVKELSAWENLIAGTCCAYTTCPRYLIINGTWPKKKAQRFRKERKTVSYSSTNA